MQEQVAVMKQLNSFLERRGLRANFLAQQVGISEASLYSFKRGYDALASAESDMAGGGGLSAETIESLAGAEEKYLDYTKFRASVCWLSQSHQRGALFQFQIQKGRFAHHTFTCRSDQVRSGLFFCRRKLIWTSKMIWRSSAISRKLPSA